MVIEANVTQPTLFELARVPRSELIELYPTVMATHPLPHRAPGNVLVFEAELQEQRPLQEAVEVVIRHER